MKTKLFSSFITQFYFAVPKTQPNSTYYFVMKIPNKTELQQIAFNGFMSLYEKCTAKPYSFLVIHTTIASDNPLCFRKNPVERI